MERYILEMEYKNYVAYQELLEDLHDISARFQIAESDQEVMYLNELSVSSVGEWINKIIANMSEAWTKFKSGVANSIWESYKKIHETTFKYDFNLEIEKGTKIPIFNEVNRMLEMQIPEYKKELNLKDQDSFLSSSFPYFYDKNKSPYDVASEKCIRELSASFTIHGSKNDLEKYIGFMDSYEDKVDKLAEDIKNINFSSKSIQAKAREAAKKEVDDKRKAEQEKKKKEEEEAKKKQQEEIEKQEAGNKDNSKSAETPKEGEPAQINASYRFNAAEFFLEQVIIGEGFADADAGKKEDTKTDSSDNGDSEISHPEGYMTDEEIEGVSTYWKTASTILSAKLKVMNTTKKLCMDVIKNFCRLAESKNKEQRKADKEAAREAKKNN